GRLVIPGTAAHSVGVRLGGFVPGISHHSVAGALLVKVGVILIEHPFDHIAVDVVQAPGIGLFFAHLLVFEVAVLLEPGVLTQLGRIIAKEVSGGGAGTAGVLPLGLGGQPVKLAGFGAQPLAVLVGGMLGHGNSGESVLAHAKAHF